MFVTLNFPANFIHMIKKVFLTEEEKIKIIGLKQNTILTMVEIANILNKPYTTVISFYQSYKKFGVIHPKRGRKPRIQDLRGDVIKGLTDDPFLTLRDQENSLNVSHESIRRIRLDNKFKFYKVKDIPPLNESHKAARVKFCQWFLEHPQTPIIFTDESSIQQNLQKGGIWRRRGTYPPGSFAPKEKHPLTVMVWGGVGPNGYRTDLLLCPPRMNAISYAQLLSDNHVLEKISESIPCFFWQQDGAPPHKACFEAFKKACDGRVVDWPACSPDLSPIEQIWSIIKKQLRGKKFKTKEELFNAIRQAWLGIPNKIIENLISSLPSRCQVCLNHNGECLNQFWAEVHRMHHQGNQ